MRVSRAVHVFGARVAYATRAKHPAHYALRLMRPPRATWYSCSHLARAE